LLPSAPNEVPAPARARRVSRGQRRHRRQNGAATLQRCLDSIAAQEFASRETIVAAAWIGSWIQSLLGDRAYLYCADLYRIARRKPRIWTA
jgi:hypothetical protein